MSFNRVFLLGNLGKDPELRYTPTQQSVCTFSLATSEQRRSAEGEKTEHTEWHNVVVWGKQAENCKKYLSKGRTALIEGRIQTRKWQDQQGATKYMTEIIANNVQFIGGKDDARSSGGMDFMSNPSSSEVFGETLPMSNKDASIKLNSPISLEDDDIPF